MGSYGRIRRSRAFAETKQFWNVHRTWTNFVPALIGLALVFKVIFSQGPPFATVVFAAAVYGLLLATCTWVVGWFGSFLINYIWLTPAALYREHQTALEVSRDEKRSVNAAIEALRAELAADREKDKHPEITGLVANFRCLGRRSTADFALACDARLCNVRPARTNLCRVLINASEVQPRLVFSNCSSPAVTLEQGIEHKIEVRATLILDTSADPHDTVEIDLSALKVSAVDGFGNQHDLRVEPGTMLFLDPDEPFAPDEAG